MKLVLRHGEDTRLSHTGTLQVGDDFVCSTLEDVKSTPVKPGRYHLVRSYSLQTRSHIPTLTDLDDGSVVAFIYWQPGKRHIMPGDHGAVDLIVNTRQVYQRIVDLLLDAEVNFNEDNMIEVVN